MKNIIILFSLITIFTSCSKDDEKNANESITSAEINIKDSNNKPIAGIVVYAFQQSTWNVIGDKEQFADGQVTTNAAGKAIFTNIEYINAFNVIDKNQNNFRFSAHYTIGGVDKKKVISVPFNKGDKKTADIIID